jgi:hypothetical protein
MSDPIDIGMLEGMTAPFENTLRTLSFHTTADLLRANRRAVVAAVPDLTVEQLRSWQVFAQILEVNGVTPAICSAALAAGIGSLDEFASRSLTQLRQIVATLPADTGVLPTDDELVAWLKDVVHLKHSGVINGTIVDADGTPVEGVLARCDRIEATTDPRGRFRLTRVRLGLPLTLVLSHPQFGTKTMQEVRAYPLQAIQGTRIAFSRRRTPPRRLSALHGDRLPALGSAPIRVRVQPDAPAPHDILRIVGHYANNDARAVSRFLDFVEDAFVARVYRIPLADLPAGAQVQDDLRYEGGAWVRTQVSAREIERMQRLAAANRNWQGEGVSEADLDRRARAILAALSDPR